MKTFCPSSARRPRGAFALVITLLMLSLLVIVSVSYLTSMTAERQTADAYDSKAVAEQAAQTGVDNASAMLAQCFRDFPDSATVWDTTQTTNSGTPYNAAIVSGANNEGTTLYLRAVPSTQDATVANPLPPGVTYTFGATSYAANDANGNDPNNPACQTFALPLISGVPKGQARLVGSKASIFPTAMNLAEADPAKQNWTDLNARRFGPSNDYPKGDLQGVIGSPPDWVTPTSSPTGPKPARAYWVNLKGSDGLINGRYAFWIDDESFRLNTSLAGGPSASDSAATPPTQPPDNTAQPTSGLAKRGLQPGDLMLLGTLNQATGSDSSNSTNKILGVRASFPGYYFPDPLAFGHAFDVDSHPLPASTTNLIDKARYLTTNQSGTLNLTRHGTQRLNLNSTVSTTTNTSLIQRQVDQLVQTMEFHLPYFGQRFYRTSNATDKTTLNALVPALGGPKGAPFPVTNDNAQIYYYKVAANIRDYVDTDSQPTMIGVVNGVSGKVMSGQPTLPLEGPTDPATNNEIWAQGKESAPLIQEVTVRYRPVVGTTAAGSPYPKAHFDLLVDYYIEFWNMTDRDIYVKPQSAALPNLGNATIFVRDQQTWAAYIAFSSSSALLERDPAVPGGLPMPNSPTAPPDCQIDLLNPISDGTGAAVPPSGIVFRAGTATVITTDPDFAAYTYREFPTVGITAPNTGPGDNRAIPGTSDHVVNLANLYYCPVVAPPASQGTRHYSGKITDAGGVIAATAGGLVLGGDFSGMTFSGTEISLVNSLGYLDLVRGAITKTKGPGTNFSTNTWKFRGTQGHYNDFGFGGALMGNAASNGYAATASQMGDPRTNNEQLQVYINLGGSDGTAFVPALHTLGAPDYPQLQPDNTNPWSDYYNMPAGYSATGTGYPLTPSVDAARAPALSADAPLTSVGQLGDVFDPARLPGVSGINYSRGGGRTFKMGQHDDRYSNDPTGNASNGNADNVPASSGWAAWRLADIFDVGDPIEMPGRINVNGVRRDNGAALLALFQGFRFQPQTPSAATTTATDPIIHGDGHNASASLASQSLDTTTGASHGFSQIVRQMIARLQNPAPANGPSGPFFERGEFGELATGTSAVFGSNPPLSSDPTNDALVSGVDMNRTFDHSREELFRRIAQMICTRGDTFTVYAVGQSIVQPAGTTAATADNAAKKITGTQRMRVTFRLVPQRWNASVSPPAYEDFHPGYIVNSDNTLTSSNFAPASNADASAVLARFAKPDRYNVQILQAVAY